VVAVIEDSRGALDREVFARSRRGHRVLLTEDKDFGTAGRGLPGVATRFPAGGLAVAQIYVAKPFQRPQCDALTGIVISPGW
jgi:hypothetical protein